MDQFVNIERIGWFKRFKNAIAGIIFAPVFGVLGLLMIHAGELEHAQTTTALKKIEKQVQTGSLVENEELFRLYDTIYAPKFPLKDKEFGLYVHAIKLYRRVFTWQWIEKVHEKTKRTFEGGEQKETTYTYQQEWKQDLVNSNEFEYPDNHQNPVSRKYYPELFAHQTAFIRNYTLDSSLYASLMNFEPLQIDVSMFKMPVTFQIDSAITTFPGNEFNVALSGASYSMSKLKSNFLYLGNAEPSNPEIGDTKIEFWYIPNRPYSVIGQKNGNTIQSVRNDSLYIYSELPGGGKLHSPLGNFGIITTGNQTIKEMFKMVHRSNNKQFLFLRIAGLLFTVAGFLIFGYPLQVLFSWLPFVGAIWEKIVFKLLLALGTFVSFCTSAFFFFKYNSIYNLTIWDLYYVLITILLVLFVNKLSVSVKSGNREIYHQQF